MRPLISADGTQMQSCSSLPGLRSCVLLPYLTLEKLVVYVGIFCFYLVLLTLDARIILITFRLFFCFMFAMLIMFFYRDGQYAAGCQTSSPLHSHPTSSTPQEEPRFLTSSIAKGTFNDDNERRYSH